MNDSVDDLSSIRVDFDVDGEVDQMFDLYIAPIGLAVIQGTTCYGGVQTNVVARASRFGEDRINLGLGGLFSRWSNDGRPLGPEYAQGDSTTYVDYAGYEGEFVGVRRKITWGQGAYSFEIRRLSFDRAADGAWFGAYLDDRTNLTESYLGSLWFQGSAFRLGRDLAAFYEIYGNSSQIPTLSVTFHDPVINGRSVGLSAVNVNYPDNGFRNGRAVRYSVAERGKANVNLNSRPEGLSDGVSAQAFRP